MSEVYGKGGDENSFNRALCNSRYFLMILHFLYFVFLLSFLRFVIALELPFYIPQ